MGADSVVATNSTNGIGPRIQFESPVHDFGRAKAGDQVRYSYVFTNTGDQVLNVMEVRPGCGCTTAGDWTRKVEPGKTGSASVVFNSSNFNGPVQKIITVTSNDKQNSHVTLQLRGTVWREIEVIPQLAYMNNVFADTAATITVRVVNNLDRPLTLSSPQCNNKSLTAELKTIQPDKEFQVVISTVPPLPLGAIQAQVTLRTSSGTTPSVTIPVIANVQAPIAVTPARIDLPNAPLTEEKTYTINILNKAKDALALSDPAVNATGVDVQLTEKQPGRAFAAVVTFPRGFEIARGDKVELDIKSSNPGTPLIKVPVMQLPRSNAPLVVPIKPQAAAVSPQAKSQ